MFAHALDRCADYIEARAQAREAFEEKYGARAGSFLAELKPLFLLYRRLPFAFDLPLATRHLAGIAALYIAEHQDFLDDSTIEGAGLIDDVWVAFRALVPVVDAALAAKVDLEEHWRGETALEAVVGLARNLDLIKEAVPSKVRDRADQLLGLS